MTEKNRDRITAKQLMVFIMATQIGIGILLFPSQLAEQVGQDGWISISLAGMLFIFFTLGIIKLVSRYGRTSIFSITLNLYGKVIGAFLNGLILFYLVAGAAIGLRMFGEVVRLTILRETPMIMLSVLLLLPAYYMAYFGLKTISRFDSIIIIILLFTAVVYLLFINRINRFFLMPLLENPADVFTSGVATSVFALLGIELIPIIYPNVSDRQNGLKYAVAATAVTTLFYIITVIVLTGFFGHEMLKKLTFPIFTLTRSYKLPVFERTDLIYVLIWFPAMGISMMSYYFSAFYSIKEVFHVKKRGKLISYFSIAVILLSIVPESYGQFVRLTQVFSYSGIAFIGFLIFSCLLSYFSKKGVVV